jgi:hypothetical protein
MATIDSSLVQGAIKRMISTSPAVKSLVRKMFRQLEADASIYEELDSVDQSITEEFNSVVLRKVYITTHRHNYRVIFAHWTAIEHVDILMAFPRKDGYEIDWSWVLKIMLDRDPR